MAQVTLYIEDHQWKAFRIGCLEHDVSASELVRGFIMKTLREWQKRTQEPTQKGASDVE